MRGFPRIPAVCYRVVGILILIGLAFEFGFRIGRRVERLRTPPPTTTTPGTTTPCVPATSSTPPLPLCPEEPPNLSTSVPINRFPGPMLRVESIHGRGVGLGGVYKPRHCRAHHRVAIVVPYRDRKKHLLIFLNHLVPFLKRQMLEFQIFVVEQSSGGKFNRAMLMNVGFWEAMRYHNWQCVIFHDVDLIPENDLNFYDCPTQPRHMSVAIDTMNYRLLYDTLFGGVIALTVQQMRNINGFSNKYFGWGGEDDDMYKRIIKKNYTVFRRPNKIARYTMIRHEKELPNPARRHYLKSSTERMMEDGLNSLKYTINHVFWHPLFLLIMVNINQTEVLGTPRTPNNQAQSNL